MDAIGRFGSALCCVLSASTRVVLYFAVVSPLYSLAGASCRLSHDEFRYGCFRREGLSCVAVLLQSTIKLGGVEYAKTTSGEVSKYRFSQKRSFGDCCVFRRGMQRNGNLPASEHAGSGRCGQS